MNRVYAELGGVYEIATWPSEAIRSMAWLIKEVPHIVI